MTRRQLSASEEAELAAWAEATRDDESVWDFANPVKGDGSVEPDVIVSVRLRPEQFRALKDAARRRGASIPQLVQEKLAELAS